MAKKKKLMLLGGIRYLLPAIEAAHKLGCHVITVDYLPDNIAHKYSDEYHNVSIMDKEAVLTLAQKLEIDGILSFAVDPGVVTAAYVAEQMSLPFSCSYKSACILQDKSSFRKFLTVNGFNAPKARGYDKKEDAIKDKDYFNWPVIVKPVDSAGSKGVTKVDNSKFLGAAIETALSESHNNHFIIEDFLESDGMPSGTECFFINGQLKFNGIYDQYFDIRNENPYVPTAECWPSTKSDQYKADLSNQLQKLSDLLHFQTGIFNVEWRVCKDGKVYLMEVSPRAGGNRLAEILKYATGTDIIDAEIRKSVGDPLAEDMHDATFKDCYSIYVLHSDKEGVFDSIKISDEIPAEIIEKEIRICKGERIMPFSGANNATGTLFFKFKSRKECDRLLPVIERYISVNVS